MASGGRSGYGVALKMGNSTSPETFTQIAEVRDFDPPFDQADVIEVTNHDSPGGYKEFIRTLFDAGEISGTAIYTGVASQSAVRAAMVAGAPKNFTFTIPLSTPKTIAFTAIINKWDVKTPLKDAMLVNFSLRVTGQPTGW